MLHLSKTTRAISLFKQSLRTMTTVFEDNLVMYMVLRKDLTTLPGWNTGALVTQGAHAATACLWEFKDDANVQAYMAPECIDHMHKVTLAVSTYIFHILFTSNNVNISGERYR